MYIGARVVDTLFCQNSDIGLTLRLELKVLIPSKQGMVLELKNLKRVIMQKLRSVIRLEK
jgi:hypothetical protein